MYRLKPATLTRVSVTTGSTRARGSARMPVTDWACGASGGSRCNCTEKSAISSSAKKKSGIEYSVNDTPVSRWSLEPVAPDRLVDPHREGDQQGEHRGHAEQHDVARQPLRDQRADRLLRV